MDKVYILQCHVCRCFFAIHHVNFHEMTYNKKESLLCPACGIITGASTARKDVLDNRTGVPSLFKSTEREAVRYFTCQMCGLSHMVVGHNKYCIFCGGYYHGILQEKGTKQAICVLPEEDPIIDTSDIKENLSSCVRSLENVYDDIKQLVTDLDKPCYDSVNDKFKSLLGSIDDISCDVYTSMHRLENVFENLDS